MNAYDTFLVEEIFPAILKSLKAEDNKFREEIKNSKHKKFYAEDSPNLSSYIFTERTLQYFIFRDLCRNFQLFPEDPVFGNTKKRMDISIYKNMSDYTAPSEIGLEIKKLYLKKNGEFHSVTMKSIISDFDKLKKALNKNKYILLLGLSDKTTLNQQQLEDQFHDYIDKRKLKKFGLKMLHRGYFKTKGDNGKNYYQVMIWKLLEN
jgi:hypothetical protein